MPAGALKHKSDPRPQRDAESLREGRLIADRYRIERQLRTHPVWLAATDQGDQVALKSGPREAIAREYRLLEKFSHPNIVRALDYVEDAGASFIVLEYLPGGDLVSLAGAPPRHWQPAIDQLIAALGSVHAQGWVHRDIKARNVMFDAADRVRLIDFGSAQAIGSEWTIAGTTAVAAGRGNGPVALGDDLYALAALVFELVQGAPPGARRLGDERPEWSQLARNIDAMLENPMACGAGDLARLRAGIKSAP